MLCLETDRRVHVQLLLIHAGLAAEEVVATTLMELTCVVINVEKMLSYPLSSFLPAVPLCGVLRVRAD